MNNDKQLRIADTICKQIHQFNKELLPSIGIRSVSPMTENDERRGGAIIHLNNDIKILVELTWLDLYNLKIFDDVKSVLKEKTDDGTTYYDATGNVKYELDNCYFDMLANVIETAWIDCFNNLSNEPKETKDHLSNLLNELNIGFSLD